MNIYVLGLSREIAGLANRVAGDSENEATEITPDTDTDSQEQLPKSHQQGGSFKRPAPVMGGRGLETRNSKRSQHHPTQCQQQQLQTQHQHKKEHTIVQGAGTPTACGAPPPPITVGALEVQNVKRAINRYGTLPKGARIGAYLESLRQTSGGDVISGNNPPPAPISNQCAIVPPDPPPLMMAAAVAASNVSGSALSPRAVVKTQPQMIRSNSSGGVTMTNSATASLNKLQRHRTTTDGTMITFSSFRATSGSPKRALNPTLADLEFPPPPLDLPPPSEDAEIAQELGLPIPSRPQLVDSLQMSTISMAPSNDVSNTEPSVEEASSRFGVSLRRREPSTDSCSSLGSPAATGDPSQTSDSVKEKLEMKLVSEIKERAEHNHHYRQLPAIDVPKDLQTAATAISLTTCKAPVDPVLQLVSELAESMNLPKVKPTKALETMPNAAAAATATSSSVPTFKAQLKKVEPKPKSLTNATTNETNSIIDFKSRLRKVENNNEPGNSVEPSITPTSVTGGLSPQLQQPAAPPPPPVPSDALIGAKLLDKSEIIAKKNGETKQHDHDNVNSMMLTNRNSGNNKPMKSINELAKISAGVELKKTEIKIDIQDEKKRDASDNSGGGGHLLKSDAIPNADDDKRKSTGSISSLKKLWEAKEGTNADQMSMQLSPKLAIKSATINNNKSADGVDENEDNQLTNRKPAVPIKPTKLVSIYATPIQVKLPPPLQPPPPSICDPNNSTTNTTTTNATTPAPATITTSAATTITQINRDVILELVASLEMSLKISVNTISASQWLQLSDKLNILQNSCVVFADKETMPPHSKFHFRELVSRVETQSRHLRSAGTKNVLDNEKLVLEVGQSLKQISNALHR